MKKKLLITVIMILYLYGCQERNNSVFYCQVENKIEEYPDSSFFFEYNLYEL